MCPRVQNALETVQDRYHIHDARRLSELLPIKHPCIDLTATSPPYWNLKDYGVPNQTGYGQSKGEFLEDMESVLRQILHITRDTGSLWLVTDTYRESGLLRLLPFELAQVAQAAGWEPREIIVWDKQHSVPWTQKGQLRNVIEYILVFSKTARYKYYVDRIRTLDELSKWWVDFPERFHPKGKVPSNVWHFPIRTQGAWNRNAQLRHVCPFPTRLAARIIEVATDRNDTVLEPFAGSGVMLAQAELMERHFIGLDVNPDYAKMYETVVREEVRGDWEDLQRWRGLAAKAQVDFERTVMKLRALKYTRKVATVFMGALRAASPDHANARAVICFAEIPRTYVARRGIQADIFVVAHRPHEGLEHALAAADAARHQAPLSHFGIKGRLRVCSALDAEAVLGTRCRLYLYPRSKARRHYGCARLSTWLHTDRLKGAPVRQIPLLANFPVDVEWVVQD